MKRRFAAILGALALSAASSAPAQQPVKIGLIMPYSGQFADAATQMDNAIKLYMKQHGDTVAGRKLEIIRRDTGGVAPDIAKRHAQELVVRDKVDILAGFVLTPNALAAADVSAGAPDHASAGEMFWPEQPKPLKTCSRAIGPFGRMSGLASLN